MSGIKKPKGQGIVGSYLDFIDSSALFKKPISCFFFIVSLLIPLAFLHSIIQNKDTLIENTRLFFACILILMVLIIAGVFGALIWWRRCISSYDGPKFHVNLRRFIQTLGEWTGTLFAIIVFGCVTVILLILKNEINEIRSIAASNTIFNMFPIPVPVIDIFLPLYGIIGGFLIIIATKIFLFLYDLFVHLISGVWKLLVRIVLYYYRCTVKIHRTIEQNTSVWIGLVWLFSAAVVISGLILCYKLIGQDFRAYLLGILSLALGLGLMAFLVAKRKNYNV